MACRIHIGLFTVMMVAATALPGGAQLLPQVTPKPAKPPATKPAQIVVETSPNAEVYLDDQYTGRASPEGRLVIGNPKPGEHNLRVSLAGKRDFQRKITVAAGKEVKIAATLTDLPGSILVRTTPGAEVSLDNSSRGVADGSGQLTVSEVATGVHALRIAARGKKDLSQAVNVSSGQETRVEAAPADLPGSILIKTTPGAEVSLDNSRRGVADAGGQLTLSEVATGVHALRIAARGKKDFSQTVNVSSGQETRVEAALLDLAPAAGSVRENPSDGLKYVWIPPGTFMMGCSASDKECDGDEKPSHRVTISKGFWIGQTEATVGAFKRFVAATGRQMPDTPKFNSGWANDDMPIVNVTWDDAHDFCAWTGGRLPTEAEWEYAARGGSAEARYGPIDEIAWYDKNSGGQTHAVTEKRANGFGLFDTLGNAWEWVNDWYDRHYYLSSPGTDPPGPASGKRHVLRGGSWGLGPRNVRVSLRYMSLPGGRYDVGGFRCGGEVAGP
jgi:formylglycine-generating enzyme required for sulfatase activity